MSVQELNREKIAMAELLASKTSELNELSVRYQGLSDLFAILQIYVQ
jgi:hypothetical protein